MFSSLRYLILSITSRCNLHCQYCYQAADNKGMDMSAETLEKALTLADNGQPIVIQITGGEPTLLPEIIAQIGSMSQQMQVRPRLAIQTNATLISSQTIDLFKKYQIEVGVSIDGPPNIQDQIRGDADKTLKGIGLLEEFAVPFRVTTVVSQGNILFLDKLALMLSRYRQCRGIGLDLLIEKGRAHTSTPIVVTREQIRKGISSLVHTLKALNSRRHTPISLREMEFIKNGSTPHTFCHAASNTSLAVQSDGSLFPCGQTMGDPLFSCGSLSQPTVSKKTLLHSLRLQTNDCIDCPLQHYCPGECPSRLYYNRKNTPNLVCELYKTLKALL